MTWSNAPGWNGTNARLGLFHHADRLAVAELAAMIPLVYTRNTSLRRSSVQGWWEFGKSWANFADITIDRTGRLGDERREADAPPAIHRTAPED